MNLSPREMPRSERGGRDWNSEHIIFSEDSVGSDAGIGRKVQDVRRDLTPLEEQGEAEGFFNNAENCG